MNLSSNEKIVKEYTGIKLLKMGASAASTSNNPSSAKLTSKRIYTDLDNISYYFNLQDFLESSEKTNKRLITSVDNIDPKEVGIFYKRPGLFSKLSWFPSRIKLLDTNDVDFVISTIKQYKTVQ